MRHPRSFPIFWPLKVATAALTIIFLCHVLNRGQTVWRSWWRSCQSRRVLFNPLVTTCSLTYVLYTTEVLIPVPTLLIPHFWSHFDPTLDRHILLESGPTWILIIARLRIASWNDQSQGGPYPADQTWDFLKVQRFAPPRNPCRDGGVVRKRVSTLLVSGQSP